MVTITTIFTAAGVAVVSSITEKVLESLGHGDKVPLVKLICYVAVGYVALDAFWDGISYVKSSFGVRF